MPTFLPCCRCNKAARSRSRRTSAPKPSTGQSEALPKSAPPLVAFDKPQVKSAPRPSELSDVFGCPWVLNAAPSSPSRPAQSRIRGRSTGRQVPTPRRDGTCRRRAIVIVRNALPPADVGAGLLLSAPSANADGSKSSLLSIEISSLSGVPRPGRCRQGAVHGWVLSVVSRQQRPVNISSRRP